MTGPATQEALRIEGLRKSFGANEVLRGIDLAVAAHISAIDYFGEVPWADYPIAAEWYVKMKSRPSFRTLLADRVPGQPPVSHYAELDA